MRIRLSVHRRQRKRYRVAVRENARRVRVRDYRGDHCRTAGRRSRAARCPTHVIERCARLVVRIIRNRDIDRNGLLGVTGLYRVASAERSGAAAVIEIGWPSIVNWMMFTDSFVLKDTVMVLFVPAERAIAFVR